ncbi:NHL repeat-containing protein [Limnoglobus roseus]|uniref:Uncharacterized protein n=1 Tax=Limnoglobus roseus TaxID=2598579 RepID=A0A5C1AKD1_9BACT|nr:hypothetical protein [Limnoglobus roseus]QEL19681.1 hypothetical protein PX52LOC_06760 [Limnoglobus roseus]
MPGLRSALSLALFVGTVTVLLAQPVAQVAIRVGAKKVAETPDDKKSLDSMSLKADDTAGLVKYFKQRTLSDTELAKLQAVIDRLGDENFEKRVVASGELEKFGPGAIGILRTASQVNPDPEIAYRAGETLKRIEKIPHAVVASAAARALANAKAPDAAAALIGFLPMSDTKVVEHDIRLALEHLVVRDGKIEPVILSALADKTALRRSAAVSALLNGTADTPALAAEASKAVKAILATESDPETKFEATYTLATKLHDADSITHMIDLLPDASRGRLWQIEDFLVQLAGPVAPKAKMGPAKSDTEKARDEWKRWWDTAKPVRDLSKFVYKPTTTGCLLLLSADQQGYGNGIVSELGPDLQRKWRFGGVYCPADVQPLPNGNILVMEQNYQRIMERDTSGNQVNVFQSNNYGQPFGFQRLPDGSTLVAFQRNIVEYDKDWKETNKKYTSQNFDLVGVQKLGNGPIVVLARDQNRNQGRVFKLDDKWKEVGTPITTTTLNYYQARVHALPDERVLVVEQQRVAEYDLKTGKKEPVWTHSASNPSSAERLPNGNTLIVEQGNNTISEVTTKGEVVWKHIPTDARVPVRAIRR